MKRFSKIAAGLTDRLAYFITGDRKTLAPIQTEAEHAEAVFRAQLGKGSAQTPATTEPATDAQVPVRFDGPWPLNRDLMRFRRAVAGPGGKPQEEKVPFTLSDAYMGIFALGGNGAGKTSGTGAHVGLAYLKSGMGGLILCAKSAEADDWQKRVIAAGRGDDLVMFGRDQEGKDPHGFNFLAYEMEKGKGNPAEAAVNVLMELVGANAGSTKDPIWEKATRKLLKNCFLALQIAGEKPTLGLAYKLATDKDVVARVVEKGLARKRDGELNTSERADLDAVFSYIGKEWAGMNPTTKTSVLMNMSTLCDPFMTGEVRDRFTLETTHTPDDVLNGKVVVVCLDVKTYDEAGRSANILWKYTLQRAVERRQPGDDTRPTFIYADECQFFVTAKDADFVTTSRSSRCSMIYLTQSKANMLSRMSKDQVDAILACFQTRIFHHNTDPETNNYAAETVAKTIQTKASNSSNFNGGKDQGASGSTSYSQAVEHQLMPVEFTRLATGGEKNRFIVSAYLYLHGDLFSQGRERVSYALIFFNQRNIVI